MDGPDLWNPKGRSGGVRVYDAAAVVDDPEPEEPDDLSDEPEDFSDGFDEPESDDPDDFESDDPADFESEELEESLLALSDAVDPDRLSVR